MPLRGNSDFTCRRYQRARSPCYHARAGTAAGAQHRPKIVRVPCGFARELSDELECGHAKVHFRTRQIKNDVMTAHYWRGMGFAIVAALCGAGTIAWLFAPTSAPRRKVPTPLGELTAHRPPQSDKESTYRALVAGPTLKKRSPEPDVGSVALADRWAPFTNAAAGTIRTVQTGLDTALASPNPDNGSQTEAKKTGSASNAIVPPLPRARPPNANIAAPLDPPLPRPRSAGSAPRSLFTAVTVSDDRYPDP